jgi:transcriptional regulator with XRE-family HTH domain
MKRASPPRPAPHDEDISHQVCRRVKELRKSRGWSLDTLSKACGVSRSMLSQIERGETNPTLAVTFRIAQAFGMPMGEFVALPNVSSSVNIIRAQDHAFHYRSDKDCRIRTLSPLHLEKDVEFYEVQLQPGGALRSAAHYEGTREFLTVQKGRIQLESGADSDRLNVGDSASYRADLPHAIINAGRTEAVIFLVDIYR